MPDSTKLIINRELQTYQCDRYGNMRPGILMTELQGMGDAHAEMLGCGRTFIHETNVAWVVTHYLVDIVEMPRNGEMLTYSSWPAVQDNLRATRDFEIRGPNGELKVRATSQWVLFDLTNRRLARINDWVKTPWPNNAVRAYDRKFEKFSDFDAEKTHVLKCRFDDIDENQHINNAVYAVWATESVGYTYRDTHKLKRIELNFKHEINPTTPEVYIDVKIDGLTTYHKIRTADEGEKALVVCYWEPRE
ncbi:MAG: hypothetical protein IKZ64_01720 [Alphaproteobacteria bacterium]|nr:hypothetical protein [Alphaproteobacteria bacterium]